LPGAQKGALLALESHSPSQSRVTSKVAVPAGLAVIPESRHPSHCSIIVQAKMDEFVTLQVNHESHSPSQSRVTAGLAVIAESSQTPARDPEPEPGPSAALRGKRSVVDKIRVGGMRKKRAGAALTADAGTIEESTERC
jgi:hypothetical protein